MSRSPRFGHIYIYTMGGVLGSGRRLDHTGPSHSHLFPQKVAQSEIALSWPQGLSGGLLTPWSHL